MLFYLIFVNIVNINTKIKYFTEVICWFKSLTAKQLKFYVTCIFLIIYIFLHIFTYSDVGLHGFSYFFVFFSIFFFLLKWYYHKWYIIISIIIIVLPEKFNMNVFLKKIQNDESKIVQNLSIIFLKTMDFIKYNLKILRRNKIFLKSIIT